jgi:SAM-dependent methyltransferase
MEAIARRWNTKAGNWDRALEDPSCHLNEDRAYGRFLDQLSAIVRERAAFCRQNGVVDAGCATGLVLAHIIPGFAWGLGVDISSEMISVAQAKNIPKTRFVIGDCFNLPALAPKAGAVISRGVLLSHYGSAHAVDLLRSAFDTLLDGGFILWDFLNEGGRTTAIHAPENKTYFDPHEVCEIARRSGFSRACSLLGSKRRVGLLLAER